MKIAKRGRPDRTDSILAIAGSVAGSPSVALDDLTDVTITSVSDGDVLVYDSGSGDWVNSPPSGGLTDAYDLGSLSGAESVDWANGTWQYGTLTGDVAFSFAAVTSGKDVGLTLELAEDGTGGWDVTWPGSVVWLGGTEPTHDTTAGTTTVYAFLSRDGGTTWIGGELGAGGAGTPSDTVSDETTWGISPDAGASTDYSRGDHTHGTPPQPSGGEILVADGTSGPSGIVPSEYVEMTTQRTTTSATLVDITGATVDITLQRAAQIAVWLNCEVSSSGAAADIGLAVNVNGTDHDVVVTHLAAAATDPGVSGVVHRTDTALPPGTYTVKGRFERAGGAGTPAVDRADLLVMALGLSGPVMLETDDGTDYLYSDA